MLRGWGRLDLAERLDYFASQEQLWAYFMQTS